MRDRTLRTLGLLPLTCALGWALAPATAFAGENGPAEGEASASASVSLGGGSKAKADADAEVAPGDEQYDPDRKHIRWIDRWAPEDRMSEIGVFGGVFLPSGDHEIYQFDDAAMDDGWKELGGVQPDIGARLGFYPIRHFGVEAEFAGLPLAVEGVDDRAFAFAIRAQLVGQIGWWSVVPFFTVGAGTIAVSSPGDVLGTDQDEAFHVGAGAKAYLNRYLALRLDFRNNFTSKRGEDPFIGTSHQELLLGLSFTLGRDKNEMPPDTDGDGVHDGRDKCPEEAGVAEYEGCPIPDKDGDGVLDPDDKCPDVAGSPDYQGCEIPDTDGDGILDNVDVCPDKPGVAEYDGCPIPDTDGDGFLDPDDKCPKEPETENGFLDSDGCPDEVPEVVKSFVGVIEGIYFDTGKATIRKKSEETLDKAVKILADYPEIRLEITGHTDSRGKRKKNLTLSHDRAESVKAYMVEKGIAADRLEIAGFGPDKPVDSNDTKAGRQKNRRIEFRLLKKDEHAEAEPDADAPAPEAKPAEAKTEEKK